MSTPCSPAVCGPRRPALAPSHGHLPVSGSEISSGQRPGSGTAGSPGAGRAGCTMQLAGTPWPPPARGHGPRDRWGCLKGAGRAILPQPAPPLHPQPSSRHPCGPQGEFSHWGKKQNALNTSMVCGLWAAAVSSSWSDAMVWQRRWAQPSFQVPACGTGVSCLGEPAALAALSSPPAGERGAQGGAIRPQSVMGQHMQSHGFVPMARWLCGLGPSSG